LRILHISSARDFGGGERYLVDLVNALAARGHDLYVALRRGSPLIGKLKLPTENVITLPLRNALDARSAGTLAKLTSGHKIEIVHAHMARDYPLAAYAARRNPGARLIVTRHVLFPLSRLHKVTLARVSRVIAVSHAVERQVRAQALVPPGKITVIHNGIDCERIEKTRSGFNRPEFCQRWNLPADSLLVGSVGTLTPLKGHEDFLKAAAQIKNLCPQAFFIISGVDSSAGQTHRHALERSIKELGLVDRVCLIGWMDNISELFCALDVFVSASRSESFGLAIVEAMAAGAAVVATKTEGALEIVSDGVTGVLVPVGGTEHMAQVITELLLDPVKRRTISANAGAVVQERFSLKRMVEQTEKVYLEMSEP